MQQISYRELEALANLPCCTTPSALDWAVGLSVSLLALLEGAWLAVALVDADTAPLRIRVAVGGCAAWLLIMLVVRQWAVQKWYTAAYRGIGPT